MHLYVCTVLTRLERLTIVQESIHTDVKKIMNALIRTVPDTQELFTMEKLASEEEFEVFCQRLTDDKEFRRLFVSSVSHCKIGGLLIQFSMFNGIGLMI